MLLPSKRFFITNILPLAVSFIFWSRRSLRFVCLIDPLLPKTDQWLLVMSTQLIGFSIGGICKRILVAPPSMIWPVNLVTAALFNTLHSQETSGTHSWGGVSRGRFFTYVFVGYTLYSQRIYLGKHHPRMLIRCCLDFLPSYLFTALSSFSWVCWIAPNNRVVNQLFGVKHGMAMGILTFDWGQISYNTSPLSVPWWAAANAGLTIVFFYWIMTPILYVRHSLFSFFFPAPLRLSHYFMSVHERLVLVLPSFGVITLLR